MWRTWAPGVDPHDASLHGSSTCSQVRRRQGRWALLWGLLGVCTVLHHAAHALAHAHTHPCHSRRTTALLLLGGSCPQRGSAQAGAPLWL